jgi:hypothetical protein
MGVSMDLQLTSVMADAHAKAVSEAPPLQPNGHRRRSSEQQQAAVSEGQPNGHRRRSSEQQALEAHGLAAQEIQRLYRGHSTRSKGGEGASGAGEGEGKKADTEERREGGGV